MMGVRLGVVKLVPGDLLIVFSEGVKEATRHEEEFGEARLVQEVRARSRLAVAELVDVIFGCVLEFSAGAHSDD
jgi:serine phosphatase RsbU (regulator of sigma subunit)